MPIEIREIEVVMTVTAPETAALSGPSSPGYHPPAARGSDCQCNMNEIVQACVEQVMRVVNNQTER